jgi:hypothetical protein
MFKNVYYRNFGKCTQHREESYNLLPLILPFEENYLFFFFTENIKYLSLEH